MISENSNKVSNLTILKERSLDMTNRFQIHRTIYEGNQL